MFGDPVTNPKGWKTGQLNELCDVDYDEYVKRVARSIPLPGDIIYCREGARFGNAAKIPTGKKVCLGQRMMLFRADSKVATPEFIWAFLSCERTYQQAVRRVGGTASPHVNVEDIKAFATIIPPLPLQEKFALISKTARHRTHPANLARV